MPNLIIPPRDLPSASTVFPTDNLVVDDGATVSKATVAQVVAAGLPPATLEEAEAGVASGRYMSPVTTAAAIAAQVREFQTRQDLIDALTIGSVDPGQLVSIGGISAVIDPTATGTASALGDLGVNGVRLSSRIIDARWFGLRDGLTSAQAVAAINAANTYAKAAKNGTNSVVLVLSGSITIANPILLGGATALFHIDWSGLTVNVATGGTLAATPTLFAVTCESANSQIKCGRVNVNKICNGVRINNSDSSYVLNPNVRRYLTIGIEVTGNCAGMKLDTPISVEWLPSDSQYFVEASYIGTGLRADSADFVVSNGTVGWCKYCLWITSNAGGFEAHGFHPYNGDVTATVPRQHPFCVVNEATGPAFLYDCYIDNGYVDDRSGTLRIQGGWHLVLLNRVNLAQPYVRIRMPAAATDYTGTINDFDSSIGFYTGSFVNNGSNLATDITMDLVGQRGTGRISEVARRRSRIIPSSGDTIDDYTTKQGTTGVSIRQRYQPGNGTAVDVVYKSGATAFSGKVLVSNTEDVGIGASGSLLNLYAANAVRWQMGDAAFFPNADNTTAVGRADRRASVIYAASGTINTSDERAKEDIRELSDAERAVAARCKGLVRAFRFKGASGRIHFGMIAQEVAAAFEAEGLDPFAYGIVCYDEWEAQGAILDDEGNVVSEAIEAGDRWGLRYDELAMFLLTVE